MHAIFVAIHVAVKNLRLNKRRSFLTTLGIVIGITAVIMVMTIGAGAQELILGQLKQRGTNMIAVLSGASDEEGPPAQAFGIVTTTLTYEDGQSLLDEKNVAYVTDFAGYVTGNDQLQWDSVQRQVTYTGTTASYQEVEKVSMATGRFFTESENSGSQHMMVLGAQIAEEIFGNQDPVGEMVRLKGKNFTIVGVLAAKGSSGFENPDQAVLIPLFVAQKELLGIRHVSFLRVLVDDETHVDQSAEEIKQTLFERHEDVDFSVRTVADLLSILTTVTNGLKFFLVFVASIALFVGGVGIMNIMLISVKEKTHEIGLRKAVGARNQDIMWQFLIETIVLALSGGFVGCVMGIVLSYLIVLVIRLLGNEFVFSLSFFAIALSLVLTMLIGLVFGLIPSRKASRLSPMEALRYE